MRHAEHHNDVLADVDDGIRDGNVDLDVAKNADLGILGGLGGFALIENGCRLEMHGLSANVDYFGVFSINLMLLPEWPKLQRNFTLS